MTTTSSSNIILVFDVETIQKMSSEKTLVEDLPEPSEPIPNKEIIQLSCLLYDVNERRVLYSSTPGEDLVKVIGKVDLITYNVHHIKKADTIDKQPIKYHINIFIEQFKLANQFVGHNIQSDITAISQQVQLLLDSGNCTPEEVEKYNSFLLQFNKFSEKSFCTLQCFNDLEQIKQIATQIKSSKKKLKNEAVPEGESEMQSNKKADPNEILFNTRGISGRLENVYKYLFKKRVTGPAHNSLVDVAMTLCIFVLLTQGIDICQDYKLVSDENEEITTDDHICSLLKPVSIIVGIQDPEPVIIDTGKLIESFKILKEEKLSKSVKTKLPAKSKAKIGIGKEIIVKQDVTVVATPETEGTKSFLIETCILTEQKMGESCDVIPGKDVLGGSKRKTKKQKTKNKKQKTKNKKQKKFLSF